MDLAPGILITQKLSHLLLTYCRNVDVLKFDLHESTRRVRRMETEHGGDVGAGLR